MVRVDEILSIDRLQEELPEEGGSVSGSGAGASWLGSGEYRCGLFAALLLVNAGSACSSTEATYREPSLVFTMATAGEVIIGWDPTTYRSGEIIAMPLMYEGLTRFNSETDKAEPLLAESYTANEKSTEWTFKLRSGVTFHTGRQLTSLAVKEALERTMEIGSSAFIWDSVASIEAPEPLTVVFRLHHPAPIDLIAGSGYAAAIYDTRTAGNGDLAAWFESARDAGTGPYRVEAWSRGDDVELRLTAYDDYWGGWQGRRYRHVVFRVVLEPTTAAQLLRAGKVSWVEHLPPQLWASFAGDRDVKTTSTRSFENYLLFFNTQKGALKDQRVRQAISYAVDYDGIIAAAHGSVARAHGLVPHGLWGHTHDLPVYDYDLDRAAELLRQAGYGPQGKPLRLELDYMPAQPFATIAAMVVKSNLADLNVTVDARGLLWETLWAIGRSPDPQNGPDMSIMVNYPDIPSPESWFLWMFRTQDPVVYNFSRYSNPVFDAMLAEARRLAASDRKQAIERYRRLQVMLLEDAAAVFLGDAVYQRALLRSVGGFVENPIYPNVVFVWNLRPQP